MIQHFEVRFPVWKEEFLGGNADCEEDKTFIGSDKKVFICIFTTIGVRSWLTTIEIFSSTSAQPTITILKEIENIKGFVPIRGVVTANFTGIYF